MPNFVKILVAGLIVYIEFQVTNLMKWRLVYSKMQLPPSNTASTQIKNAYKKYVVTGPFLSKYSILKLLSNKKPYHH